MRLCWEHDSELLGSGLWAWARILFLFCLSNILKRSFLQDEHFVFLWGHFSSYHGAEGSRWISTVSSIPSARTDVPWTSASPLAEDMGSDPFAVWLSLTFSMPERQVGLLETRTAGGELGRSLLLGVFLLLATNSKLCSNCSEHEVHKWFPLLFSLSLSNYWKTLKEFFCSKLF